MSENTSNIDDWLNDVRQYVLLNAPEILPILTMYEGEARFGREYIAADLAELEHGAKVLEVGAGCTLLSCQLVREGFQVTALEPIGDGFSHFDKLRALVLKKAELSGYVPRLLTHCAEDLVVVDYFEYAFSVNVMEHVNDVKKVINNIVASLLPGGRYRFTCPNYLFPYEPHFNIPTFFSKKITEKIFKNRIFSKSGLPDPEGTWRSLNWITLPQVNKIASGLPGVAAKFNREFLVSTFERINTDENFALRRSKWMRTLIQALLKFRVHRLAGYIPLALQPAIDCVLTKRIQ